MFCHFRHTTSGKGGFSTYDMQLCRLSNFRFSFPTKEANAGPLALLICSGFRVSEAPQHVVEVFKCKLVNAFFAAVAYVLRIQVPLSDFCSGFLPRAFV